MPSLLNIATSPRARVAQDRPSVEGCSEVTIHVSGLMCESICARRVVAGLLAVPSVSAVDFDPTTDCFMVRSDDEYSSLPAQLCYAAEKLVVARPMRVLLEKLLTAAKRLATNTI